MAPPKVKGKMHLWPITVRQLPATKSWEIMHEILHWSTYKIPQVPGTVSGSCSVLLGHSPDSVVTRIHSLTSESWWNENNHDTLVHNIYDMQDRTHKRCWNRFRDDSAWHSHGPRTPLQRLQSYHPSWSQVGLPSHPNSIINCMLNNIFWVPCHSNQVNIQILTAQESLPPLRSPAQIILSFRLGSGQSCLDMICMSSSCNF